MIRPPLPLIALLALSSISVAQSSQSDLAQTIQHDFAHKLLTLRGLYRSDNLQFSSDGAVFGHPEVAFAVSDAKFDLQSATLKGSTLTLTGDLPIAFYDEKTSTVSYHLGLTRRTIQISLNDPSPAAAMETFWKVFFHPNETIHATCTAQEFQQQRAAEQTKASSPNAQQLAQPDDSLDFAERGKEIALCRPNGDRIVAYSIRRATNIKAPHAVYTPDPPYPENERGNGTVTLQVIVDPAGHASSIVVLKPIGHGFDEAAAAAVHTWKFEPATREGEPVPVSVNIEVDFRRG